MARFDKAIGRYVYLTIDNLEYRVYFEEYGSGIPGMATTAGWDLTTGFGSPKAYDFVHDLAAAIP